MTALRTFFVRLKDSTDSERFEADQAFTVRGALYLMRGAETVAAFAPGAWAYFGTSREGAKPTSPIPARYLPATLRDMTLIDVEARRFGLGFVIEGIAEVFLSLSVEDGQRIADQFKASRAEMDGGAS